MGTGPAESVFGENSFYQETRSTRLGGRHVAKRSSDHRLAYSEVKIQVRDLVRVVGIVLPFAPRGSVFGENSFYRPIGVKWRPVSGAPSSGTRRKNQAKFRDGTLCGL